MKATMANTDAIAEKVAVLDNKVIPFIDKLYSMKKSVKDQLASRSYNTGGYHIVMDEFVVTKYGGYYAFLVSTVYD